MAVLERSDLEQISLMIAIGDKYKSARLLEALPDKIRSQVLYCAYQLAVKPPLSLQRLNETLGLDVVSLLGIKQEAESLAGVVALLAQPIASGLLKQLKLINENLAHRLAEQIFFFEDIIKMPDYPLQVCLFEFGRHGIGLSDVASALWGAEAELKDKFLKNISKRRAQVIEDELSYFEEVLPEVVLESRQKCATFISQYGAKQGLVIPRPNGDSIIWAGTVGQLPSDLQQVIDERMGQLLAYKETDLCKLLLEVPHRTLLLSLICAKPDVKQKILKCSPKSAQRQYEEIEPLTLRNGLYFQQVLEALAELSELTQEAFGKK